MKNASFWLILLLLTHGYNATVAAAVTEIPIKRTVLALYDSRVEKEPRVSRIHRFAEAPLNHLGLKVVYHDLAKGLPPNDGLSDVRGVLSWFSRAVAEDSQDYVKWATKTIDDGHYFVVLGDLGFRVNAETGSETAFVQRFTSRLGIIATGRYRPGPYNIVVVDKVSSMVEYERRLTGLLPGFPEFKQVPNSSKSYLEVRLGDDEETDSHLVVIGERGAIATSGYEIYTDPRLGYTQWRIDPFAFFRAAFRTDELPKPDPTTLAGRRVFYAHVDGDGWRSVTRLPRYQKTSTLCAEVVLDTILRRYSDLPITVAPIVGDLDYRWRGTEKAREIARRIFALPNVEVGSHTLSHPFVWDHYRDNADASAGDREASDNLKGNLTAEDDLDSATFWSERARQLSEEDEHSTPPYRAYSEEAYDLAGEIQGSIAFLDEFLATQKRVALVAWSGDTHPYEEALATAADGANVANINGGFNGYHQEYPSITSTSPIGLHVGRYFQVYGGNGYELSYTNSRPDGVPGLYRLTKVLEETEIPKRLRPFEVYWHMYSAQSFSSLNGVLSQLDLAQRLELAPVTAATYARMASGFDSTRLFRINDNAWRIENRSDLSTIRFDIALFSVVDFASSRGIIGQRHYQGSLYIYLDSAEPAPVVVLTTSDASGNPPKASRPYLVQSRWSVENLIVDKQNFEFSAKGFGAGDMVWQVPQPGQYDIAAESPSGTTWNSTAVAAMGDRLIRFVPPDEPAHSMRIRVSKRLD